MLSRSEFEKLFDRFSVSAWRLEIQGEYHEPEEREPLRRFLAGEPDDLAWMDDWFTWIRDITAAGKRIGRTRVLTDPLTDYQHFELGVLTPPAVLAGEDIRVLSERQARELCLPRQDFWLFDGELVAVIRFGQDGVVGAELVDEPGLVRPYLEARDRAWDASTPFGEWAATGVP
jgi:hypothetical protein